MTGPLLVGIDIGSSRVRALIFDRSGRPVAQADRPTPMRRTPEGWTDYPVDALWAAVAAVLREATGRLADPMAIAGLAVASVGESAVPVDAEGRPLADAIAWFDGRSRPEAEALARSPGIDAVFAATGVRLDETHGLCKLLHLKRTAPERMAQARCWLNIADYIAFRLSGVAATDYTLASRSLALDIRERRWNAALLQSLGIDPELMAPLAASGHALGPVTLEAALETGLPATAIVGVGAHDHLSGAFAAGALVPCVLLDSLGTAEALLLAVDRPVLDPVVMTQGYTQGAFQVDRPLTYLGAGINTSGGAVEWLRRTMAEGADHATLIAEAEAVGPGSGGVLFLPHLRMSGAPTPDDKARGAFIGLTSGTTRGALFRAVLEGLAFAARAAADGLAALPGVEPPQRIRAIGGNTQNALLLRIKAAAFGRPIESSALAESTSLGAALFGGLAAGVYADAAEAVAAVAAPRPTIDPDPAWAAVYDRLYREVWSRAYAALRPLNHAIDGLGLPA